MYIPELYKNENQTEIRNFIHENGFALLINQVNGKPWATHIPLLLETNAEGKELLVGHLSLENPQAQSLRNDSEVLAVFSGPHAYISSSWYDHENVPTWNYIAVHIYGTIRILNYDETITSLKKLVDKYESQLENPIRIEDLSEKTMRQARGIVAFEIAITSIQATKKLSQNRDAKNYATVISELEKRNDYQSVSVAAEMKKCPR
jgi:transcriptional regulator